MKSKAGQIIFILIQRKLFHIIQVIAAVVVPSGLKSQIHSVWKAILQENTAGKKERVLGVILPGCP